jgi:16S rRNA (uracil1498-N3)-methyltransferase
MTRRRWIADEFSDTHAALIGAHADHLSRVLRARVGQEFDITTASTVRRGRITLITPDRVEFELGETIPAPATVNLTLLLSIFKFDRMEWAIEKCTELGVARIIPTIAQRTESHLASAAAKRVARWQRIALQASEQSRRLSPPEISQPIKLTEAVSLPGDTRIVLSESENEIMLKDALQPDSNILLAIGPEGGWTESEFEIFHSANWTPASLGPTILRAETAAIAATVLAISLRQSPVS